MVVHVLNVSQRLTLLSLYMPGFFTMRNYILSVCTLDFFSVSLAEEQLINQNTILIMIVVGIAVVVFVVILYCLQQRRRYRGNNHAGKDDWRCEDQGAVRG